MDHQSHLESLFISRYSSSKGMLHAARAAIGALPMIAKALLAKANKPLRIIVDNSANTGSTDCESFIRLPPVPLPTNDEDIEGCIDIAATYYGLIHHEVGHCNHSDIVEFRKARQGIERALVNIIEDVRMENVHIKTLPAARAYLDALSIVMSKQGRMTVPPKDAHPGSIFTGYVMFHINSIYRLEPVSKANYPEMRDLMKAAFTPEFTQRLDELLEETPLLADTRGSLDLARKVIALVQDEQQNTRPDSNPANSPQSDDAQADSNKGDGKSSKDVQSDDSDADDTASGESSPSDTDDKSSDDNDSESSSDSDAKADDDETSESNSDAGQSNDDSESADSDANDDSSSNSTEQNDERTDADSSSDAQAEGDENADTASDSSSSDKSTGNAQADANDSTQPSDCTGENQMPGSLNERLNSLLSTTDDTGSDRHDAANKMLEQLVKEMAKSIYQSLNLEDAIADLNTASSENADCSDNLQTGADHDLDSAYSTAMHIRRKMLSELDALTNSDVFVNQRGRRLSSRHLHRVISGDKRVFETTIQGIAPSTAVMLVQDVSGSMDGQPIKIASQALYASATALEGIEGIEVAAMAFPGNGLVLDFGASPRVNQDKFQLSSWGGTPMGEGIHVALNGLLAQPQERKLMIVLTDGQPCNPQLALAMIAAAENNGVEVFGVGILTDCVQQYFSRWIKISDINELPEQLVALVRDEVLQSIAA